MRPIEERIYTGELTVVERMFGQYRFKASFQKGTDTAIISMYDMAKRLPLQWSNTVTWKQAHGALTLFEHIGYFDMVL